VSRKLLNTYLTKACENKDDQMPWGSLRYLVGEAMYGGRVTDDFDRRVLITYLNEYMGDFLFDSFQPFHFYHNEETGVDYAVPECVLFCCFLKIPTLPPLPLRSDTRSPPHRPGPKSVYVSSIETMPLVNTPEVFGLHPNAEINFYTNATRDLWRTLIELQPRTGGATGGISRYVRAM
jgi:dynein heavy chain